MSSFSYKDIEIQAAKACELHSRSHFAAAEKIYINLIELLPDSSLLHYNIGLLYYETKNFEKALSHYSAAQECAPHDPDILFNYALCQKKLGKFQDAVLNFITFTSTYPDDPDGFYNLGNCHRELKKFEEAIISYRQVLKIDPNHLPANKNLAYVYHLLGDQENAMALYRHVLNLEPGNTQIEHMIAAITGENIAHTPDEYIRNVFDDYSETFESHLLEDLQYTVPTKLRERIDKLDYSVKSFYRCIDLGCGTGLAGNEFHERCDHLTGIDISEKMIEKAKSKNIYNVLKVAEATIFLKTKRDEYDLVIAADVLTYIGDLDPIFAAITPATTERALFCFSTENGAQPHFYLGTTGRFAHSREYVIETASQYGWSSLDIVVTDLRKEGADWVAGSLFFMVK